MSDCSASYNFHKPYCYDFTIYHISPEEMNNREVVELSSIHTDNSKLNSEVVMGMTKEDIFGKFGYPTYIKEGSFEYNTKDYWGVNLYFDFKDSIK
jgi:hypothetical protein